MSCLRRQRRQRTTAPVPCAHLVGILPHKNRRGSVAAPSQGYESIAEPLLEPEFSRGFQGAGGRLPRDWRRMTGLLDLVSLCESLTHPDLLDSVVHPLLELASAAI